MVGAEVRKACAMSSVVSPQTSRSVSATCASGGRTGWQQMKISLSWSSSMVLSSSISGSSASASSRIASSFSEASKRAFWRMRSIALKRPAETSQANGLAGTPCCGHCAAAATKAS